MDWDLTSYFEEFDGRSYQHFKAVLLENLSTLRAALEAQKSLLENSLDSWAGWISDVEDLDARFGHLSSYLGCLNAADAENEAYQREEAWLQEHKAGLTTLYARFNRLLGKADE